MKLLISFTSPYARMCRVIARESGLMDKVEEVETLPFENGDLLLGANPSARVPALIRDDGPALSESALICDYLIAKGAGQAPLASWDDKRLRAIAHSLIDLLVLRQFERLRPEDKRAQNWIERRETGVVRVLDQLESEAGDFPDAPMIAGLTAACALAYIDFRWPELNWREGRPGLERLLNWWNERPAFAETAPPAG